MNVKSVKYNCEAHLKGAQNKLMLALLGICTNIDKRATKQTNCRNL